MVFENKIIFRGCNFHFIKARYNIKKMNGIIKYPYRSFDKTFISILKFVPYLQIHIRTKFYMTFTQYFTSAIIMINIASKLRSKYIDFFEYFGKNCLDSKKIWSGNNCDNSLYATNNSCENFHSFLYKIMDIKRLMISYLVDILFIQIKTIFRKYCH